MRMRTGSLAAFVHALLIAGVATAAAQQSRPSRMPPPRPAPLPTPGPPTHRTPPPTTAPAPGPAALSVPDPFAGLRPGPRDLYQRPDGGDRFQHLGRNRGGAGGYFPGPYYNSYYYPDYYSGYYPGLYGMPTADTYWPRAEVIQQGRLVLQTQPDAAQVFVDGYYEGLAGEFGLGGRAMDISAGSHRIELRAPGYETLAFSVIVEPNDTVRYRGDLQPLNTKPTVVLVSPAATAAASQTAPKAAKNFYVIPNCYAGDKPPKGALPKGCDLKKLQTRK